MLSIDERPCHIGGHINATTEKHGEDDVSAADIKLDGIMLTDVELNSLLNDPFASRAMFNREKGKLNEPMFPQFKPFVLKENYEHATVYLRVGLSNDTLQFTDCKLKRLTLEPQTGGMTKLSLSVRVRPEDDSVIATLFRYMNHDANVLIADAVVAEKGNQKDLALNTHGEGEEPDANSESEEAA